MPTHLYDALPQHGAAQLAAPPCTLEVAADAATGYQRSMYDFAAARTLPTFESTRSQVGLSYAR